MDWLLPYILSWETLVGIIFGGLALILAKPIFGIGKPRTIKDISLRGMESLGLSKKKAINEIRQRKKEGRYFPPYPNGWFAVIESDALKRKGVEEAYYFGKELVIWRGENGVAYVADAYCPHIGAHLGVEGQVKGNCIQCPFHHWQFDGSEEGRLSRIPYSDTVFENVKLNMWKTLERNGFVFVWYHAEGTEPTWEPPLIPETLTAYCHSRAETTMACHIQDIFENLADTSHFSAAHGSFFTNGQQLDSSTIPRWMLKHGGYDTSWKALEIPGEKHMASVNIFGTTELFGFPLLSLTVAVKQHGPGFNCGIVGDHDFVVVTAATPIEPHKVRLFNRFYSTKLASRLVSFLYDKAIINNLARDVCLFNRKIDIGSPPIVKEEKSIKNFRRWYNQFYSKWEDEGSKKIEEGNNNEW